jgi:hypothetical protein
VTAPGEEPETSTLSGKTNSPKQVRRRRAWTPRQRPSSPLRSSPRPQHGLYSAYA